MIHSVNGYFLVEPILRTDAAHAEIKKKVEAAGLVMAEKAAPDNKEKFEGIPNQGYIRYLPEDNKTALKVGMHIVFDEKTPNAFKDGETTLFALKENQIVAVVLEEAE